MAAVLHQHRLVLLQASLALWRPLDLGRLAEPALGRGTGRGLSAFAKGAFVAGVAAVRHQCRLVLLEACAALHFALRFGCVAQLALCQRADLSLAVTVRALVAGMAAVLHQHRLVLLQASLALWRPLDLGRLAEPTLGRGTGRGLSAFAKATFVAGVAAGRHQSRLVLLQAVGARHRSLSLGVRAELRLLRCTHWQLAFTKGALVAGVAAVRHQCRLVLLEACAALHFALRFGCVAQLALCQRADLSLAVTVRALVAGMAAVLHQHRLVLLQASLALWRPLDLGRLAEPALGRGTGRGLSAFAKGAFVAGVAAGRHQSRLVLLQAVGARHRSLSLGVRAELRLLRFAVTTQVDTFSISALHLAITVPYFSNSWHKNEKVTSYLLPPKGGVSTGIAVTKAVHSKQKTAAKVQRGGAIILNR
eukprot:SAG31_NODE_1572_length_7850_cov_28.848794_7_plen_420_part_00